MLNTEFKKSCSSTDGSTKRPCFLQFFRFTVNGHIERDSACLTDQDGSLLYVLCKRNVTKWEYTQVRGSNLVVLNYSNIAFYCPKLSFRSHIESNLPWGLRYIVRQFRAITPTVTNLSLVYCFFTFFQISVKCAYITGHLSCNYWYFCWKLILLSNTKQHLKWINIGFCTLKLCCACIYCKLIIDRAWKNIFIFLQEKEIRVQNTDKCLTLSTRTLSVLPCNNGLNQKWTWTRKINKDDNVMVK